MNLILLIDMGFRRVIIRKRRAILFYLILCFIFFTVTLIFVLLIQPNRLLSKYRRSYTYIKSSNSEFSHNTKYHFKRNVQDQHGTIPRERNIQDSIEERQMYAKSAASKDIHVVIGYYQGNDYPWVHNENLTEEILNTNMYDPDPKAGVNGEAVITPAFDSTKKNKLFQINRFNLLASDRIPLNRSLLDVRRKQCLEKDYYKSSHLTILPTTSVIIVFHNEAWSTLLRTVHSVINRSPKMLLEEIILVDDASQRHFLKEPLEKYVSTLSIPTKVLRSKERIGLIKARLLGAEMAKGKVLTFLDAHCETTEGWLEPLLARIHEHPNFIVSPVIDIINDETFQYVRSFELHQGGFNWELHFRWFSLPSDVILHRQNDPTQPFQTAVMAGGLFSIDKAFFYSLGAYDDMKIWGGENVEISLRGWMCGAQLEILPCSHVGHLFRKSSPYTFPGGVGDTLSSNLARVSLVWMDEWKDFYFQLHPEIALAAKNQSIESRLELKHKLNCKSFDWYLKNIWPNHFFPAHDRFIGKIRNLQTKKCLQSPKQFKSYGQPYGLATLSDCILEFYAPQLFIITPEGYIKTDDAICLDVPEYKEIQEEDEQESSRNNYNNNLQPSLAGPNVRIMACNNLEREKWLYKKSTKQLIHKISNNKCLDLSKLVNNDGLRITECNENSLSQKWALEPVKWSFS